MNHYVLLASALLFGSLFLLLSYLEYANDCLIRSASLPLLLLKRIIRYGALLAFFSILFQLNLPIFGTILVAIAICILFGCVVAYAWSQKR